VCINVVREQKLIRNLNLANRQISGFYQVPRLLQNKR